MISKVQPSNECDFVYKTFRTFDSQVGCKVEKINIKLLECYAILLVNNNQLLAIQVI